MRHLYLTLLLLALLVVTPSERAWATPPATSSPKANPTSSEGPDQIDQLYEAGKAALRDGEAALALGQFKSALHLARDEERRAWPLLLAIALAYRQTDAPTHATEYFRRFLAHTDAHQSLLTLKWKQRRDRVMADLVTLQEKLAQTHGFVSVTTNPSGAAIVVDGTPAGADRDATTPFGLILSGGDHMLRFTLDGHAPVQRIVTVRPGETQPLPLTLVSTSGPAPKAEKTPEYLVADAEEAVVEEDETSVLPWVTIGAAGGLAVIGAIFTGLAASESGALDDIRAIKTDPGAAQGGAHADDWTKHADTIETYELVAGVLYGLAAAGLATGIVLLVLGPSDAPQEATAIPTLDLSPAPGGLTGHATWRF